MECYEILHIRWQKDKLWLSQSALVVDVQISRAGDFVCQTLLVLKQGCCAYSTDVVSCTSWPLEGVRDKLAPALTDYPGVV